MQNAVSVLALTEKCLLERMWDVAAQRCKPAVGRHGAAIFMAAALVTLAPLAAAALMRLKSDERDVPVATDHGLAVTATLPEVVYKTDPFEIVVVVANLADQAAEITVSHGEDPLHPVIWATIWKPGHDHRVSLFPVLEDGWHAMGFISKVRMHVYAIPPGESLTFRAEVDWRNYTGIQCLEPGHPEGIDAGRYRLLLNFSYWLGDNTSPPPLKLDPATNEMRADLSSLEGHMVTWALSIEVRDAKVES